MTDDATVVPFGSYRGQPVEDTLADRGEQLCQRSARLQRRGTRPVGVQPRRAGSRRGPQQPFQALPGAPGRFDRAGKPCVGQGEP